MRTLLLATAALLLATSPTLADDAAILKRLDAMQHMLELQQKQIENQRDEIYSLRTALKRKGVHVARTAGERTPPDTGEASIRAAESRIDQQQIQINDLIGKFAATEERTRQDTANQPVWSIAAGRPTIASADGHFSLAIRSLVQFDTGYFMQTRNARSLALPNGPDLSSGSNFRRAQLGIQGVLFDDWSYYFNYDFGSGASSGNELQGRIQQAYIEYDGLAPFAVRVGAFPPSANLEDATAAADIMFLERNAPSDLARSLAGGDGRDALAVIYVGDRLFASLALTGGKVADSTLHFDEQQAVVVRISDVFYSDNDWKLMLSVAGTDLFRAPDATARADSQRLITMSDGPELTIDDNSIKLVSTGALNVSSAWNFGLEEAIEWRNLYAQAGYFGYGVEQRTVGAPDLNFDGWYAQASWIITGERRPYNVSNGSFSNPRPRIPFSLNGWGPGAWELVARYSDLDLNDHPGTLGSSVPLGGIRGGDQRIFTAALNWYPNAALKFSLQWQDDEISRIGTLANGATNAEVGQSFSTFAFRSQIAL